MTIDFFIALLSGIGIGAIAGFMPGIGIFASLTILYPLLTVVDTLNLLVFYVALASTTQYIGSITSIVFAIPGESSSLPAVKEGHPMFMQGRGNFAISGCAIGSFVGGMISLGITFAFASYLPEIYNFYGSYAQSITLLLIVLLVCLFSGPVWIAIATAALGYILSKIGCNPGLGSCFMTFDNSDLTTGLPFISVAAALYILPALIKTSELGPAPASIRLTNYKDQIKLWISNSGSSIRGTIIGIFAGFTPGVSTATSSNLAYTIEKWIQTRKGTYSIGNYPSLISAETANNAGAFTTLLPLLVLGVPLAASEALIYELVIRNGVVLGQSFDLSMFYLVAVASVFTNFIALALAWPLSNIVMQLKRVDLRYFNLFIVVILTMTIAYSGSQSYQLVYYLTVFLLLVPLGILLKNINTLPLIFLFLLQDRIDLVFPRTMELMKYAFN